MFEPKIVAFLCKWCASAGADLAGTSRIKYPPNVMPLQVLCSSRVDPTFVLQALNAGADGVLIAGCRPGDCHYTSGNYKTLGRYLLLIKMLQQLGIERERVRLEWISASEGTRFAQVASEMTATVRQLGPLRRNLGGVTKPRM